MAFDYTFWLMPAEPLKARLRAVVRDLAQEFDAPEFDPHVTFYIGAANADEACAALEKVANQFRRIELDMAGLSQSSQFTKTFFIQFRESESAKQMCAAMRSSVATPSDYALNPHLSLLYKDITEEQRQELCRRNIVPDGAYAFDAVQAIEYNAPWSGAYRVLAEYPLQSD